jgi:protein TonB
MTTLPGAPPLGFARALAASFALHLLLLWPTSPGGEATLASRPLVATLRRLPLPDLAAGSTAPSRLVLPAPPSAGPRIAAHAVQTPGASFFPAVPMQSLVAVDSTANVARRSGVARPVAMAADGLPVPLASSLPPSDGLDADGLRSYRLALAREAGRHKRYPAAAIEAGWGGTVELRLSIVAGGVPGQTIELAKSSGHALLDEAALDMLRRAAPITPLPSVLEGRSFAVSLPVVFDLPE